MLRLTLLLALTSLCVTSHRILGIFPHGARSHFNMADVLMEALALRGHEVTVVSAFPRATPLARYTDVSLVGHIPVLTSEIPLDQGQVGRGAVAVSLGMLFNMAADTCEKTLRAPQVLKLTEQRFDLVIYEMFNTDCFLGYVEQFDAPYIALSSSAMMPWHSARFGNPDNPAYVPVHFLPHSDAMGYWQRLTNLMYYAGVKGAEHWFNYLPTVALVERHFGPDVGCLEALARNTSLLLVNTHFSMNLPRPLVPAIIEVGGLHVRTPPPLPKDIQSFLDGASSGAIYFSFGSTVKASTFPEEKRVELLKAFGQLPQRVLWKWEGELKGKPDNVMVSKWMPQPGILNHPKTVAFITHGGLMGTTEAVAAGVPMVAVPLFGDQPLNVAALVKNGVAVRLYFDDINAASLLLALRTVLDDSSYAENSKRLASAFNDRPLPPLDTAIYWAEYTIRHQGAPLLRSPAAALRWYQYHLLDVLLPLAAAALLVLLLAYLMLKRLVAMVMAGLCRLVGCGNKATDAKKKRS